MLRARARGTLAAGCARFLSRAERSGPPFDPAVRKYQLFLGLPDVYSTLTAEAASGSVTVDGAEITGATRRVGPASLFERSTVRVRASGDGEGDAYEVELVRSLAVHQTIVGEAGFGGGVLDSADAFYPTTGSLALDGSDLVVGNPVSGPALLYARAFGRWSRRSGVSALYRLGTPIGAADDFATAMALGRDWLAIGMPRHPDARHTAYPAGSVAILPRSQFGQSDRFEVIDGPGSSAQGDWFGNTVATAGNLLVVGAPGEAQRGAVYVYEHVDDQWLLRQRLTSPRVESSAFGFRVVLTADQLVVAELGRYAYVYQRRESGFVLDGQLELGQDGLQLIGDVASSGERLAVAARYFCFNDASSCSGSADVRVYSRSSDGWQLDGVASVPPELVNSINTQPLAFGGHGLVFDGPLIVVSSTLEGSGVTGLVTPDAPPTSSSPVRLGVVYVFEETKDGWQLAARLGPPPPRAGELVYEGFGRGLALSGSELAVVSADDGRGPADDVPEPQPRGVVTFYGIDCSLVPTGARIPGC